MPGDALMLPRSCRNGINDNPGSVGLKAGSNMPKSIFSTMTPYVD